MNSVLTHKAILILSPQAWGSMFLSKHHYALSLARRGNRVYFLDPPDQSGAMPVGVKLENGPVEGLTLVRHRLYYPYWIKYRSLPLFRWLMQFHISRLLRQIPDKIDIVWSFELGHLYPLDKFPVALRIFHPVDEPLRATAIQAATGADIIFTITPEIESKYKKYPVPRHIIRHGLTEEFLSVAKPDKTDRQIRVGFSGNLLRTDLDRETFLSIVRDNPDVVFECWGSFTQAESNIGGSNDQETVEFVQSLKSCSNAVLHGPVHPDKLAIEFQRMDAFLICYDINKDQSRGTNYHKILEYISTGKVIISNNVTNYAMMPDLLRMTPGRTNNDGLAELFKDTIRNLEQHNSPERQALRIRFASDNTYNRQLDRISELLEKDQPGRK